MNKSSFQITENRGFKITFPNGLTLSTQFGPMNYGSNYVLRTNEPQMGDRGYEANEVEIAIWRTGDDEWMTKQVLNHDDDVKGYVDINEWLEIVDKVRNYKL